jgi:DNA-binding NtrC family response regulator
MQFRKLDSQTVSAPSIAANAMASQIPKRRIVVLSIGQDATLLLTRNQILERAGYTVESYVNTTAAMRRFSDGDFDVVVLCHSVKSDDRDRLVAKMKASRPSAVLVFVSDGEEAGAADVTVHSMDGPAVLLQSIAMRL